jgi:hypothetical protein
MPKKRRRIHILVDRDATRALGGGCLFGRYSTAAGIFAADIKDRAIWLARAPRRSETSGPAERITGPA